MMRGSGDPRIEVSMQDNVPSGGWIPDLLKKNAWAERTALRIIPIITRCAQDGRTITYRELDKEAVKRQIGRASCRERV